MSTDVVEELENDEEIIIDTCYITGKGEIVSEADLTKSILSKEEDQLDETKSEEAVALTEVSQKYVEGSRQFLNSPSQAESLAEVKEVSPPYSPDLMLAFMNIDETVHQCVKVKAQDYTGRNYKLTPETEEQLTAVFDEEDEEKETAPYPDSYPKDHKTVRTFLKTCTNDIVGFQSVLVKAAQDFEGIGWAALEVIRSADMKVVKIDHVPANRLKVLEGWQGFVEHGPSGSKRYYQPFGTKVVSKDRKNLFTGKAESYDPELDGELNANNAQWNMVGFNDGKPTDTFQKSANEIIWVPKSHPSTIYYGVSDSLPATSDILANASIRKYLLQFFDHNTVPRYVVVVKGAKLNSEVKTAILNYFSTDVRGRAHKTMVLPIPSGRGNVEVTFEKLDSDPQDGWFRRTAEDNSHNIRIAHGVPTSVATFSDPSGMGSGKGLAQAEIYKDRTVTPGQHLWSEVMNKIFELGLGILTVRLAFDELDTRDKEAQMRISTQYLDRAVNTINETRAERNLPPIKGGDRAFIKTNKGILFLDEISTLTSFEQDDERGGDQEEDLNADEPERGPGNTQQNVLENFSRTTQEST